MGQAHDHPEHTLAPPQRPSLSGVVKQEWWPPL